MNPDLALLKAENADCRRCALRAGCEAVVPGWGPEGARLMVLGEYPDQQEELLGRPFVGRDGAVLHKLMRQAGLDPAAAYLAYTVRCRPRKKADPTDAHVAACRVWLWRELQALKPAVVLALGKGPTRLLLKLKKTFRLADHLGRFAELDYLPGTSVAPWHGLSRLGLQGRDDDHETVLFLKQVKERL